MLTLNRPNGEGAGAGDTLFTLPERKRSPVTILSNGSGQDSSAMIVRLTLDREARRAMAPGELIVLGSDTGAEHPETYEQVEWLRDFCGKHGIEFVFITADMGYHSPAWLTLETQWQRNDSVGSAKGFKRSCTDNLKLIPLYAWIEDNVPRRYGIHVCGQKRATKEFAYRQGVSDVLIGFTIGEESRCATPSDLANDDEFMRVAFRRRYPLIEWGWTRTDCQNYLRSVGVPVPPPSACSTVISNPHSTFSGRIASFPRSTISG